MKGIQFLFLIAASVLTAANPTANEVAPSKFIDDTIVAKEISKTARECLPFSRPADCEEIRLNGDTASGVYTIWPRSRKTAYKSVEVYCDLKEDGGWTVLQRRGRFGNPQNYFHKMWEIYKQGFGELEKEFWIGNEIMHALTNQGCYSVRFDMRLVNETSAYALYDQFWIEDEQQKYKLNIAGYSGNAGDSMSYHHSMKFTTVDSDNDAWSDICADKFTGGWWFKDCLQSNLNGLHKQGKYTDTRYNGIIWKLFSGLWDSLEFCEIKIRPRHFR